MLLQSVYIYTLTASTKYNELSTEILARMKADELTTLIKNDDRLLLYGYYTMFEKSGTPAFNEISNKLRNVARLISYNL